MVDKEVTNSTDIEALLEEEMVASQRRAERLKQINEELASNQDSDLAKLLADIEARNKK